VGPWLVAEIVQHWCCVSYTGARKYATGMLLVRRGGGGKERAPQQNSLQGLIFTQSGRRETPLNPMRIARGRSYDTK